MREKAPLKLPPGVFKGASPADAKTRWYDSSLVRWVNGRLQPFGGFVGTGFTTASPIRRMLTWTDNSNVTRTAVLCEQNLYIIDNGQLIDISPTTPIAPPVVASGTGGYGDGAYGTDQYGTPRTASSVRLPVGAAYCLANWGQTLLAMTSSDGRLLQWDPSKGYGPAVAVTNCPTNNRCFVVTPQRYVMLFGSGNDPRHFQWCDQENINSWALGSVTGTAGDFYVEPSATILNALSTNAGILFFTDRSVYLVKYAGAAYVYGFDKIAENAAPVSAQSIVEFGDDTMWFSDTGVWVFNGSSVSPVSCDLFDWYKRNRNINAAHDACFMFNIVTFPELMFFFPSQSSTTPDLYIMFNFADNWWANGKLSRSAGVGASYNRYPLMSMGTTIFTHELGGTFADPASFPYATTAIFALDGGAESTLMQMLVDNDNPAETTLYDVMGYHNRIRYPGRVPDEFAQGLTSYNGIVDVMLTGRDVQVKVYSTANNLSWTFGEAELDIRRRGNR